MTELTWNILIPQMPNRAHLPGPLVEELERQGIAPAAILINGDPDLHPSLKFQDLQNTATGDYITGSASSRTLGMCGRKMDVRRFLYEREVV